jgi:beta-aspartyl-peptidase (threonine type)
MRRALTLAAVLLLTRLAPVAPALAATAAAANDSLIRALVAPVPGPFAPTACIVPEDQDAGAVRRLLDEQVAAWNRGDLEGFMKGYWKSDSLTFYSGGNVSHGWQPTLERYRRRYQGEGHEMGALAFDVNDVTIPARGLALVRGGWSLKMKDAAPHGLFTLWLRWFPDTGWRIVHDHSSAAS